MSDAFLAHTGPNPRGAVRLFNRQPGQCRYILGEPADMLCCGARATHGPYCAYHDHVTHDTAQRARRAA